MKTFEQSLSASRMCKALGIPRCLLYRKKPDPKSAPKDIELREQIQEICLEMTGYGYRRIAKELARQGHAVNGKKVLRLMREDNLLCLRNRTYCLTTDSNHSNYIYPNLAKGLKVLRCNQLWVSDLTYIRLRDEFVYLAVVLDAYSRRVIGWQIGPKLDSQLALEALDKALASRRIEKPLIHHSDRGVQYASTSYTARLVQNGIQISMSRSGNPYDNAICESFIKTLKVEQVYMTEYEDLEDAKEQIGHFLEEVYNRKRLHSSLGYVPPEEYESAA